MTNTILNKIVEVISGFAFRKPEVNVSGQDVVVIQARDISGDIFLNTEGHVKIFGKDIKTKAFVQKGDVIIAERGTFKAGLVGDDLQNSLAASSTYILRPTSKDIDPEYLVAYFNSQVGSNNISKAAKGSLIKNISKGDLENLEIPVPTLEKQKEIVKIFKNNLKQQKLLDQKKQLVGEVVESAIKTILTNQNI
jgi:restriction endonuclease S subunit